MRSTERSSGWTRAPTACASPPGAASPSNASRRSRTPRSVSTAKPCPNDAASGHAHPRMGARASLRRPLLIVGLVVFVLVLDQIAKALVVESLADEPLSIIGDSVELRLSRNPGGAFSILTGFTPLLA